MKHLHLVFTLFYATASLLGSSAWQQVPVPGTSMAISASESALISIQRDGRIFSTVDGAEWTLVNQLGAGNGSTHLEFVVSSEWGFSALVVDRSSDYLEVQRRIFSSSDGVEWSAGIEITQRMDEPFEIFGGWLAHAQRGDPAVVVFSDDGVNWRTVFEDSTRSIDSSSVYTNGNLVMQFAEPHATERIISSNGKDWEPVVDAPSHLIHLPGFSVGYDHTMKSDGSIFYSADGQTWERIFRPDVRMSGSRFLVNGGGTLLMVRNTTDLFASTDGLNWITADFPVELLPEGNNHRLKQLLFHNVEGFWYRLTPNYIPGTEPDSIEIYEFFSPDGVTWVKSEFPDDLEDDLEYAQYNPAFPGVPGPPSYHPLDFHGLKGQWISAAGHTLFFEPAPDGRKLGVYVSAPDGETTFYERLHDPVDFTALNDILFLLMQSGTLYLLDPDAGYPPQPSNLHASLAQYDDHVHVKWDPVEEALGYRVFRSSVADLADRREIAYLKESEFADTTVDDLSADYYYDVVTVSATGESLPVPPRVGWLWSMRRAPAIVRCGMDDLFFLQHEPFWDSTIRIAGSLQGIASTDTRYYPWVSSSAHGWQYCVETPGSLWIWDADLGWLWTRQRIRPAYYSADRADWLYFISHSQDTRWFYSFGDRSYLPVER